MVNSTGMEIVNLCDGVRAVQTIAFLLAQKYQMPMEKVLQDVVDYTHNLSSAELLHVVPPFSKGGKLKDFLSY